MGICIRCRVSGRVQGVFYRANTQAEARRLGLTGWVCNRPDGTVEVLVCGPEDKVAAFRQWLWHGPDLARVSDVQCRQIPEEVHPDFSVR